MSNTQAVLESPRPKHSTLGTVVMLTCFFGSLFLMFIAIDKLVQYIAAGYNDRTEMMGQFWDFAPFVGCAVVLMVIGKVLFSKVPQKYEQDIAPYHDKLKSVMKQELKDKYRIENVKFDEMYDWDKKLIGDMPEGLYTVVHFENPQAFGNYTTFVQDNGTVDLFKDERETSQNSPDLEVYKNN